MQISFSNPMYLWGFLLLALPILIHLLSKREPDVVWVGSIKHFKSEATRKARKLFLSEKLLLLLRLGLLALLVLIFSEPQVHRAQKGLQGKVVLWDARMPQDEIKKAMYQSDFKGFTNFYLSDKLSPMQEERASSTRQAHPWYYVNHHASLLSEADTVIIIYQQAPEPWLSRPQTDSTYQWIAWPKSSEKGDLLAQWSLGEEELNLLEQEKGNYRSIQLLNAERREDAKKQRVLIIKGLSKREMEESYLPLALQSLEKFMQIPILWELDASTDIHDPISKQGPDTAKVLWVWKTEAEKQALQGLVPTLENIPVFLRSNGFPRQTGIAYEKLMDPYRLESSLLSLVDFLSAEQFEKLSFQASSDALWMQGDSHKHGEKISKWEVIKLEWPLWLLFAGLLLAERFRSYKKNA